MAEKQYAVISGKKAYPMTASIAMIVGAIILSFVDLAFLYDVIGKVLDIDATTSLIIAFAIGLVGVGIMAHMGVKIAHGDDSRLSVIGHYLLWIVLGLALVLIRIFSATIMQLDLSLGDESLINILGQNIRQADLITSPLMFFLYIATGLMVKDGVKNLYLNPEFDKWQADRKKDKEDRKNKLDKLQSEAAAKMTKAKETALKKAEDRQKEVEKARLEAAATGTYSYALAQFREKEKEMKDKYQLITANINFVKSIDKRERDFERKVKPGLMKIVNESIKSIQNTIALGIRKKTGENITALRSAIQAHNDSRHE